MEAAGVTKDDIDLIIVGTTTADRIFPSTACLLQKRLDIHGCAAFDVQAVCTGFVYALGVADKFFRAGSAKCALVIGAETLSRIVDWSTAANLIIDGSGGIQMKGNEVFKMAVNTLGRIVDETLAYNNMTKSDIDWLVPHQANTRIINATAKKLKMSTDHVVLTVNKHGNTSAASVPLALMLEAFGGGFTWGSALIKY